MVFLSIFLQIILAGPLPPGSSSQHWTTKAVITGVVAALVVCGIGYAMREILSDRISDSVSFRVILFVTEPISAVFLSIIGSFFDIFRRSTYIPTAEYQPDWHVVFWFTIWAILASYYLVVKILSISTKEFEGYRSKTLQKELTAETVAKKSLTVQRDLLVRITAFARQLVTKKSERLGSIVGSKKVDMSDFLDQLNPSFQVNLLLQMIHEFFKSTNVNATFRLALWMKANPDDEYLSPVYSWNGEKDNCFTNKNKDRMKVLDPLGPRSEVVKNYHSNADTLRIIPNCERAQRDQEFSYFYPEQVEKVRSMMLYKHVFLRRSQPLAVVLMLVSGHADHFELAQKDEIRQFLGEMLMRVEMEWIMLELSEKIETGKARQ